MKSLQNELKELRTKTECIKSLEVELKRTITLLNDKEKEIITLQEKIRNEQNEKMDLLEETTKVKLELNEIENQNRNLKKEMDAMNEKIKKNQFGVEGK